MSLPAKPREKTTIGMLLAPIIMDLLAAKTGSERMISLNTIHTYSSPEKFVSIYLKIKRIPNYYYLFWKQ